MQPYPLANFLGKFGQNLDPFGQIWEILSKLGKIWAKIKILHSKNIRSPTAMEWLKAFQAN